MANIMQDIIQYVREHPGAGSDEIFAALSQVEKRGTIQSSLGRLQREGVLENRGGSSNRYTPALWYCVESSASEYSRKLARRIIIDMRKLHHSVREDFLAEKLDELLEAQTETPS